MPACIEAAAHACCAHMLYAWHELLLCTGIAACASRGAFIGTACRIHIAFARGSANMHSEHETHKDLAYHVDKQRRGL